jgi:glycosyltransferase involved in cell wall biosynthesis
MNIEKPSIAVLVPCYNEAASISQVVKGFRDALPEARIIVYDNNSSDDTKAVAAAAGAEVRTESLQGKGNVVRRMFADIEADVYVMVDGDATYDAASAPLMVRHLREQHLDMVVARRISTSEDAYRPGHELGNRLLTGTVGRIFGEAMLDILSGFRVFSRRFVKSFPAFATGFQTETELTIHALELRLPVAEIETPYYSRPEGSASKLNTWRDGFRILATILRLFALEQPFRFFSLFALAFFALASVMFVPVLLEFIQTGLVLRQPTLIVSMTGYAFSVLSLALGTVLHVTTTGRLEAKRLAYLAVQPMARRRD